MLWLFSMILFITYSCSDEYLDYPFNDIEKFDLSDAEGNTLKATVTSDSILVYWPPFQPVPESIVPSISVSENAKVSPASGTEVAFSEETVYTVTAQDGSTRTYTLKPITKRPATTLEFHIGTTYSMGGDAGNQLFELRGEFIDTLSAKITLIDSITGQRFPVDRKYFTSFGITRLHVSGLPYDNEAGIVAGRWYRLEFASDFYNVTFPAYYINPSTRSTAFSFSATIDQTEVTAGGQLTISYSLSGESAPYFEGNFMDAGITVLDPNGNYIESSAKAKLISDSGTRLTYQLPTTVTADYKIAGVNINNSRFIIQSGLNPDLSTPNSLSTLWPWPEINVLE